MTKRKLPKIIVAGIIEKDDSILLTKETLESGEAKWIVPGGTVEFGEKLEDALIREIKEEIGLDVEIIEFFDFKEALFPDYNYPTIILFYRVRPLHEKFELEGKVIDAQFFNQEQISNLRLVESAEWILDDYFKTKD